MANVLWKPWILCAWAVAGVASGQLLTPAWVELGENGQALARVIVGNPEGCPSVVIDGQSHPMTLRLPVPDGLRPACELAISEGARTASVKGRRLVLPRPNPSRIAIIGDTGCRVTENLIQKCTDPKEWPFTQVASLVARAKPELIVHVGDYLYREKACPADQKNVCGNTPPGDLWEAWDADFFAPAAKLLAAAPLAFSRGNHESCSRSWRGWFYYLDPRPWTGTCDPYSPPYVIKLGTLELAMIDSSENRTSPRDDAQARIYAAEFAKLQVSNAWLVHHHPIWSVGGNPPAVVASSLSKAWDLAHPKGIQLVLSGHVHTFQLLSFDGDRPPQLIAGDGGANLASPDAPSIKGMGVLGASVVASESHTEFGYTVLTKTAAAWSLILRNRLNKVLATCSVNGTKTSC